MGARQELRTHETLHTLALLFLQGEYVLILDADMSECSVLGSLSACRACQLVLCRSPGAFLTFLPSC